MPPKRSSSSASSTPNSKKPKSKSSSSSSTPTTNQKTLDFFFKNSPSLPRSTPSVPAANTDPDTLDRDTLKSILGENEDIDRLLAAQRSYDAQQSASSSSEPVLPAPLEQNVSVTLPPTPTPNPKQSLTSTSSTSINSPTSTSIVYQSLETDVSKYDPKLPQWDLNVNSETPYSFLANAFKLVEQTKSRLATVDILTNMLRTILHHRPDDLLSVLYLCGNSVAPAYEGVELGVGTAIIGKALSAVTDFSNSRIKQLWGQKGDWGDVVYEARIKLKRIELIKPKPLTVNVVYNTLLRIADAKGRGIQDEKVGLVKKLIVSAQNEEIRYVTRSLVQNMRIGAVRTTLLIALSHAFEMRRLEATGDRLPGKEELKEKLKVAEQKLKTVYAQVPNYDTIVQYLLDPSVGIADIVNQCQCQVGIPIRPMLGKPTRDLSEITTKLANFNFCCDWKYDGQRAQIHRDEKGNVRIFSRHLEDITGKYVDIVDLFTTQSGVVCAPSTTSFILDAEVVAVDDEGVVQDFQVLSKRSRKNIQLDEVKIKVKIMAFDLMYLNGVPLLRQPYRVRRDSMYGAFNPVATKFDFVPHLDSKDEEEIRVFLQSAIDNKCEGIMVKILDKTGDSNNSSFSKEEKGLLSTYEPDKRSDSWLKLKKDYIDGMTDSFDLVPIAGWIGSGRKKDFYSPILLACYNRDTEQYESVCKVMSGLSDEFYVAQKQFYSIENETVFEEQPSYYAVSGDLRPYIWFKPCQVWEIKGADLTLSPVHQAGAGLLDGGRGISLRFPRFIRVRDDKDVEDATGSDEIVEAFLRQGAVSNNTQEEGKEEEEEADMEETVEETEDEKDIQL